MSASPTVLRRLKAALDTERAVRLWRASEPGDRLSGFVVGLGRRWVLLARLEDGGYFDGHIAVRLRDVATVRRDRSFEPVFARTQPQWPPAPPHEGIDLDSTLGVLTTLVTTDGLVGIQTDQGYDALWIGVPHDLTKKRLYVGQVDYRGRWEKVPRGHRRRRIATVEIGGRYLHALRAVAGDPPEGFVAHQWPPS